MSNVDLTTFIAAVAAIEAFTDEQMLRAARAPETRPTMESTLADMHEELGALVPALERYQRQAARIAEALHTTGGERAL